MTKIQSANTTIKDAVENDYEISLKEAIPYQAGRWEPDAIYERTDISYPIVKDGELYYYLVYKGIETGGLRPLEQAKNKDTSRWRLATNFKVLMAEIVMAEFAKLGGAVFYRENMISQFGINENGVETEEYANYKETTAGGKPKFTPYLDINFRIGRMRAIDAFISGTLNTSKQPDGKGARVVISSDSNSLGIYNSDDVLKTEFSPKEVAPLNDILGSGNLGSGASTTLSTAKTSSIETKTVTLSSITVSAPANMDIVINVPAFQLTAEAFDHYQPPMGGNLPPLVTGSEGRVNIYIIKVGSSSRSYLGSLGAFAMGTPSTPVDGDNKIELIDEKTVTFQGGGTYRLMAEFTVIHNQYGSGSASFQATGTTTATRRLWAEPIVSLNRFGTNGVALVNTSTDYLYSASDVYEVRKGGGGFKVENGKNYQYKNGSWVLL